MKKIYGSRKLRQMAERRQAWYSDRYNHNYSKKIVGIFALVVLIVLVIGLVFLIVNPPEVKADILRVEVTDDVQIHTHKSGAYRRREEVPCKCYEITVKFHHTGEITTLKYKAETEEDIEYANSVFVSGNTIAYFGALRDVHVIEEGN